MIFGHMFTYTELRSRKIIQTLFLFFGRTLFGSTHTSHAFSVHRLFMRDRTIHSDKIYILEWIKVIALLKPGSKAQINLSSMGGQGDGGSP